MQPNNPLEPNLPPKQPFDQPLPPPQQPFGQPVASPPSSTPSSPSANSQPPIQNVPLTQNQPQAFNPQQPSAEIEPSQPLTFDTNPPANPHVFSNPQIQSFNSQNYNPRKKRKKLIKLMSIVLAIFILAGGVGAYAYTTMMNNKPEKVLADALSNSMKDLLDRKPAKAIGKLTYEFKGDDNSKVTLDYQSKTANDNSSNEATMRIEYDKVDVTVKGAVMVFTADQEVYFKFDDLKNSVKQLASSVPDYEPMVASLDPLLTKLDGRWIRVDKKALTELGMSKSEQEIDKCSDAFTKLRISDQDKKQVKDIFLANQFAIASEKLSKENIDGESSYHYKLDLNEKASVNFAKEIIKLESFKTVQKACEIKQEDLDRELKSIEDTAKEQKKGDQPQPVFELWVGSKTRRPTKVKVTMDDKELTMELIANIKIDAKDVSVEKPKDSTSIMELKQEIEELLGTSLGSTSTSPGNDNSTVGIRGRDTERQTDIKALHGQLEAYYAQNGFYPTLDQMNDRATKGFVTTELKGLDLSAFKDPKSGSDILVNSPKTGEYAYVVLPSGCDNKGTDCDTYELTATLEGQIDGKSIYIKQSLDN